VNDLATLTSANVPPPSPMSYTTENGIVVNVNETFSACEASAGVSRDP
jgi:hypothetical protein